jgi:hypothetical protein
MQFPNITSSSAITGVIGVALVSGTAGVGFPPSWPVPHAIKRPAYPR